MFLVLKIIGEKMVEELKNITEKLILENDNNSKEKDKYLLIR